MIQSFHDKLGPLPRRIFVTLLHTNVFSLLDYYVIKHEVFLRVEVCPVPFSNSVVFTNYELDSAYRQEISDLKKLSP